MKTLLFLVAAFGVCNNILVENISGWTEDDTVALTNLPLSERSDWVEGKSTDIHHIVVRNVHAAPGTDLKAIFDFHAVRGELKVEGVYADKAENLERLSDSIVKIDYDDVKIGQLTQGRTLTIKNGEPNCGGRWYKCELTK